MLRQKWSSYSGTTPILLDGLPSSMDKWDDGHTRDIDITENENFDARYRLIMPLSKGFTCLMVETALDNGMFWFSTLQGMNAFYPLNCLLNLFCWLFIQNIWVIKLRCQAFIPKKCTKCVCHWIWKWLEIISSFQEEYTSSPTQVFC